MRPKFCFILKKHDIYKSKHQLTVSLDNNSKKNHFLIMKYLSDCGNFPEVVGAVRKVTKDRIVNGTFTLEVKSSYECVEDGYFYTGSSVLECTSDGFEGEVGTCAVEE